MNRAEILASVAAGGVDAGLLLDTGTALGALGFDAPGRLAFLDLEEVPLRFVGAPGATAERLLVTPPGCSFRMIADRVLGGDRDRAELGSVTVVRAWARQGLGVALLPEFAVEDELAAGTLVRRSLDCPGVVLRLVWRADREAGIRELLYAAGGA
jgi:DNA-binding transcriptional LysR family regulator